MDNTDARKKNTAFPYNIYPGLTFCVPLPKRKAVHYRCCQKVFDKNSPSDSVFEADINKYQSAAVKCHAEMISKYSAVFGGFGIDKNGFNFRSNANNNSQVNDNKKWNTYGSINGFAQFMHLRER